MFREKQRNCSASSQTSSQSAESNNPSERTNLSEPIMTHSAQINQTSNLKATLSHTTSKLNHSQSTYNDHIAFSKTGKILFLKTVLFFFLLFKNLLFLETV